MERSRIDELRELVAEDPADSLLRFSLGQELLAAADIEGAISELREAVRLDPDYTAAYRYLGQALEQKGLADEAVKIYRLGISVAEKTGDLQTGKEMRVFLQRMTNEGRRS